MVWIMVAAAAMLFAVSSIYIRPRFTIGREGFRITVTAFYLRNLIRIKRQIGPDGIGKPRKKTSDAPARVNGISDAYALLERAKSGYNTAESAIRYIKDKLDVKEVKIVTVIGAGDAYHTALSVGFACTLAGVTVSLISNAFPECKKNISIIPDFSDKKLRLDLNCILKIKIAHIIVAGIKLLARLLKIKFKHAKCRNIKSAE